MWGALTNSRRAIKLAVGVDYLLVDDPFLVEDGIIRKASWPSSPSSLEPPHFQLCTGAQAQAGQGQGSKER